MVRGGLVQGHQQERQEEHEQGFPVKIQLSSNVYYHHSCYIEAQLSPCRHIRRSRGRSLRSGTRQSHIPVQVSGTVVLILLVASGILARVLLLL